jgi:hypothetical protein
MSHRALLILSAALFAGSCGKPGAAPVIVNIDGPAQTQPEAVEFRVSTEPSGSDPRVVNVWVDASHPELWKRLPTNPDDDCWSRLIVMRRLDGSETEKPDRTSNRPGAATDALPGLAGTCELVGERLRFSPRYPLLAGATYRVEFHRGVIPGFEPPGGPLALPVSDWYAVPAVEPDTVPQIVSIYPTADTLPANHLKFYLVFSEPMRQGKIWDHFELINETTGEPVPEPFRETELWSEDGKRLTLWFHPGRQKTGVNLNVEIGPILEPGNRYTLVISKDWLSQKGAPLGDAVRKTFTAGPKIRAQLHVADWKVIAPAAGSRSPVVIEFPAPLDWALLNSRMTIETAAGEPVEGYITTGPEERSWRFVPATDWSAGGYRLAVASILEDLAGNSIARPFEVDLTEAPGEPIPEIVHVPFRVTSAAAE